MIQKILIDPAEVGYIMNESSNFMDNFANFNGYVKMDRIKHTLSLAEK